MGQDQGRPAVSKDSQEYKEAKSHFSVVNRAENVKQDESATDAEARKLLSALGELQVSMPLLRSSIENSLISGKRSAALYEITKQSPIFAKNTLPLSVIYSAFAILQTMDVSESASAVSTQEEINNRLSLLKYHIQRLEVTANSTLKSAVTLSDALLAFEQSMQEELSLLDTSAAEAAEVALQVDGLLGDEERAAIQKEVEEAMNERMAASLRRTREETSSP